MTFPGTYNIDYYFGDTFEFRVYPKNSTGEAFTLDNFTTAKFTLAEQRGAQVADQISCYAAFSNDRTNVLCSITPNNALNIDPTKEYVYDVEVVKPGNPYDLVYTLLTGTVNITQDVTVPQTAAPEQVPDNPTDLVIGTITSSTVEVSWTAPTTGGDISGYKVAYIPYTTDSATLESAIENATTVISSTNTSYTFFGLEENTQYSFLILGTNATSDANYSTVLTNSSAVTTADNPLTIDPDFFVTNNGNIEYLIDGVPNDTITLMREQTYVFNINAPGHPFYIQLQGGGYDSDQVYTDGISGSGTEIGNVTFYVREDAPDTLYYQCQNHSGMGGIINIIDGGS